MALHPHNFTKCGYQYDCLYTNVFGKKLLSMNMC
ncbi:hypothetical protein IFVP5_C1360087 [Vibrio parahaemolyticus]